MHRTTLVVLAVLLACTAACAEEFVLEDFNDPAGLEARKAVSVRKDAPYEFVTDGAASSALSVQIKGEGDWAQVAIDPELLEGNAAWDQCNGISFMLRGDGSANWGCVQFGGGGSNGQYAYELYVPLRDAEWHEVRVHFSDLVAAAPVFPIGTPGMLPPSGIARITVGDRWYLHWNNSTMPAYTLAIDEVKLIDDAPVPPPAPSPRPLDEVLRLLRDRRPVSIQCMGDSVTAGTGLSDRDNERYAVVLQAILRERLGYDDIMCYSRAVGGAKLGDARFWAVRDFDDVEPDLVTIAYGYNDKSGAQMAAFYRYGLSDYIERIARLTDGQAAICPIATLPGGGPRFVMMDDFAQAIRDLCELRGDVTCIDLAGQIKPMGREAWGALLGDMAHPNAEGHQWLANANADRLVERVEALE